MKWLVSHSEFDPLSPIKFGKCKRAASVNCFIPIQGRRTLNWTLAGSVCWSLYGPPQQGTSVYFYHQEAILDSERCAASQGMNGAPPRRLCPGFNVSSLVSDSVPVQQEKCDQSSLSNQSQTAVLCIVSQTARIIAAWILILLRLFWRTSFQTIKNFFYWLLPRYIKMWGGAQCPLGRPHGGLNVIKCRLLWPSSGQNMMKRPLGCCSAHFLSTGALKKKKSEQL